MKPFLETLAKEGILGDGAMGTQIYARGVFINRCFEELNHSNPTLIQEIHCDYLNAGAQLIETNTFLGNRPALQSFGLAEKVVEINQAGARIAREATGDKAYVAGAVGPLSGTVKSAEVLPPEEVKAIFAEQIRALVAGGVDVILLETFYNLNELRLAIEAAKSVSKLPLIAQVSVKYQGDEGFAGIQPEDAVQKIESWGADVIGVNCSNGPVGVLEAIKLMAPLAQKPLSAFPNAGLPQSKQGRLLYMATPEYMAEYARRLFQAGAQLVGGCCGTTPEMIREMGRYLKSVRPTQKAEHLITIKKEEVAALPIVPLAERSRFGAILGKKFGVSVELDPPRGLDASRVVEGAKILKEAGVDVINIADGPRAMARMGPVPLALQIQQQTGMETIIHFCCRDRNLLGLQMDLIGANALGLKNLMLITGDPPKMGEYPDATAVFDVDAIGLVRFASNLNRGLDFSNRSVGAVTSFVIGCGCNPGAIDMDLEIERLRKKISAGAEYVFSQPVYDGKLLDRFLAKAKSFLNVPFFVGILPLASLKNAEFLHNEVPGMQIPKKVMEQLEKGATPSAQREIGLEIAKEALVAAKSSPLVKGTYIMPPFGRVEPVLELLDVI